MNSDSTLANLQKFLTLLDPSLHLTAMLTGVARQLVEMFQVNHSGMLRFGEEDLAGEVIAEYPAQGAVGLKVPLTDYPLLDHLKANKKPLAVLDAQHDPIMGKARATMRLLGIQSIVIIPLLVKHRLVGSLSLDVTGGPRLFTDDELELCHIIGNQIAVAVDYTRALELAETNRIQADTLRQAAATLNATLDLQEVLERILAQLQRVITYDSASIILRDQDTFRVVAARGFPDSPRVVGMSLDFASQPHFQEIDRTRRPLVIKNIDPYDWDQRSPDAIKSWIGAPLLVSDRLIGLLAVDHTRPDFYTQADGQLVTAFADLAAIALENARLYEFEVKQVEQELEIARKIQQGFFPQHIPQLPGWRIAAACFPARETGGDFYEFVERSDGGLGLIVGDVSGKSISAAMLMAAAQSLVNAKGSDYDSPAQVLAETNRLLYKDMPHGNFVAMAYALLQSNDDQVCLSNGGQIDPFLVPAGDQPIRLIETPGERLPLGIVSNVPYQETALTVTPGDLLIFCTDGVVERKDERGRLFGFERVAAALEQVRGQPPEIAMETLLKAADAFANGASAQDDVTLVIAQRKNE
ncbi:MAG: GAF domain-containing SpoIIE family protein phosphatase [Chloroflexota bacterium]